MKKEQQWKYVEKVQGKDGYKLYVEGKDEK